jgi:alpha-tubulin suppressor-like RCC1 family protein
MNYRLIVFFLTSAIVYQTNAITDKKVSAELEVVAGYESSCFIKGDQLKCSGAVTHNDSLTFSGLKKVAVGRDFICAQDKKGITCWGKMGSPLGQLTPPKDLARGGIGLTAGMYHACGIKLNGHVKCWGSNSDGQLEVPNDLGPVKSISAGGSHTCAINQNNNVRCWGAVDSSDQISAGLSLEAYVKTISSGAIHTCSITKNDEVECWGMGYYGNMTYKKIIGKVKNITVGWFTACAITADAKVKCWDDPTDLVSDITEKVGQLVTISAGSKHFCGKTKSNEVKCWGSNSLGQTQVPTF